MMSIKTNYKTENNINAIPLPVTYIKVFLSKSSKVNEKKSNLLF